MNSTIRPFFALLTLILLNAAYATDKKIVRIGLYEYPPYMHEQDQNGRYGYCYEVISTILSKAGYKTIPFYNTISALTKQAEANRVDAICALPRNQKDVFEFSKNTLIKLQWRLWMRKDINFKFTGEESYSPLRIIKVSNWDYQEGLPILDKVMRTNPRTYEISGMYPAKRALMFIDTGRADAIGLDVSHAKHLIKNNKFKNQFKSIETESGVQCAGFAVAKTSPLRRDLIRAFDAHYEWALSKGIISKLKKKYFNESLN